MQKKTYLQVVETKGNNGYVLYMSGIQTKLNGFDVANNKCIVQAGRKVFKWAVERMSQKFNELHEKNKLSITDIDYFIPHSANLRIIGAICRNTGFPLGRTFEIVDNYGNTSAVTITLALNTGVELNCLKQGDKMLILDFDGGLTYAGTVV